MKSLLLSFLMVCSLTATAQESADPNMGRAETMFGFLLQNQADSLYENLSAQVKPMVQKQQFDGILGKVGALVIFDAEGKMLGIQLVPAAAVKKE